MFRVALIGRWHPHANKPDERYAKELLKIPGCAVSCVCDPDPEIARQWGEEYSVPAYTDPERVFSDDSVDGVLVTSAPKEHRRIIVGAAEHKKHVFTEKVLALSMDDALEISKAVKKNGVKFCISLNRLAVAQLSYAKTLFDSGILGRPVLFRCLCSHDQGLRGLLPEYWYDPDITGGGALIDMGFNSAYIARYVMGKIGSVGTLLSGDLLGRRTEDTCICSLKFASGAVGTAEASFCSPAMSVFELEVCGTEGSYQARFGRDHAELRLRGEKPRILTAEEIPQTLSSPVSTWVNACTTGSDCSVYGIDAALELVEFMDAAYRSAKAGGAMTPVGHAVI